MELSVTLHYSVANGHILTEISLFHRYRFRIPITAGSTHEGDCLAN